MNRRTFLRNVSALAGATAVSSPGIINAMNADAGKNSAGLPLRVLGRTGEKITILGLGTAPMGLSKAGAGPSAKVYEAALDAGVNYVDTAHAYDEAELYLGDVVPRYRDKIFLTTKALSTKENPREAAAEMQQQFETSLRLLKTTHVDLLHVHSIGDSDPAHVVAPGGPLEFVKKMKEKGLTRFIGVTGHNRVPRFAPVIETGEVDVIMVALNFVDYHQYHFEEEILPVARKHHCGILAMKVYGGHATGAYTQRGPSKIDPAMLEGALRYSLGIEGVAAAVVGFYSAEEVLKSVEWAKRYSPLTLAERGQLRDRGQELAPKWGLHFGPAA